MELKELKELALHAAKRTAPANFSLETVDEALLNELKSMTTTLNDFMKNRYDIYDIIIETAEKIVPVEVMQQLGAFCEIKQVGQGETVMFKRGPIGRNRAKKFLTQVGLSGVYETARLDTETYKIGMKSIGGGITMDFERFLDGAENLADLMKVMSDAQVQGIYGEVQKALMTAATNAKMPARNKVIANSFNAKQMVNLVNTVKAYGAGCTIFASPEFIIEMGVDYYTANNVTKLSPEDMSAIHDRGRISMFRGTPVVEIKQGFEDDSNEKKLINPQYAYVLPTGHEKVVKLVLEGTTQMWDWTNKDQSMEIMSYRKVGVGIINFNNWGVYKNESITATDWVDYAVLGIDVDTTDHGYPRWN